MRAMAKVLLVSVGVAVMSGVSQPAAAGTFGYAPQSFGQFVQYVLSLLSGHDVGVKVAGEAQARH